MRASRYLASRHGGLMSLLLLHDQAKDRAGLPSCTSLWCVGFECSIFVCKLLP